MVHVALAGDWHGNTGWAAATIEELARNDVDRIYHLGDFGIWPGRSGEHFLDEVERALDEADLDLWVTLGNHEDYEQVAALPRDGLGLRWARPHIALLERGHRWSHGGRTFVSLGGAPSIDYEFRQRGLSWWPEEAITMQQACEVADAGPAEIMLAHDSPNYATEAVRQIVEGPSNWSPRSLRYAAEGRKMLDVAMHGVQPKLYAHGHYHVADDTGEIVPTRFLSLACDEMTFNSVLLDLETLDVQWETL